LRPIPYTQFTKPYLENTQHKKELVEWLITRLFSHVQPSMRTGGVAQVVERLPWKCEALNSKSSTSPNNNKTKTVHESTILEALTLGHAPWPAAHMLGGSSETWTLEGQWHHHCYVSNQVRCGQSPSPIPWLFLAKLFCPKLFLFWES
jgi:hypothetical protein